MSVCLCQWTVCTVNCTVDCTVGYNRFVQQSPILYLPPHNLFLSHQSPPSRPLSLRTEMFTGEISA